MLKTLLTTLALMFGASAAHPAPAHDCPCLTANACEMPMPTETASAPTVPDDVAEACARASHEANRAYCLALGDTSLAAWDQAPDWQRSSVLVGVRGVLEQGNTPEQSHESWLATKAADGWRYGPVKDPEAKTHPCFVPYDQLPPDQRAKDHIFISVVRAVGQALLPEPLGYRRA